MSEETSATTEASTSASGSPGDQHHQLITTASFASVNPRDVVSVGVQLPQELPPPTQQRQQPDDDDEVQLVDSSTNGKDDSDVVASNRTEGAAAAADAPRVESSLPPKVAFPCTLQSGSQGINGSREEATAKLEMPTDGMASSSSSASLKAAEPVFAGGSGRREEVAGSFVSVAETATKCDHAFALPAVPDAAVTEKDGAPTPRSEPTFDQRVQALVDKGERLISQILSSSSLPERKRAVTAAHHFLDGTDPAKKVARGRLAMRPRPEAQPTTSAHDVLVLRLVQDHGMVAIGDPSGDDDWTIVDREEAHGDWRKLYDAREQNPKLGRKAEAARLAPVVQLLLLECTDHEGLYKSAYGILHGCPRRMTNFVLRVNGISDRTYKRFPVPSLSVLRQCFANAGEKRMNRLHNQQVPECAVGRPGCALSKDDLSAAWAENRATAQARQPLPPDDQDEAAPTVPVIETPDPEECVQKVAEFDKYPLETLATEEASASASGDGKGVTADGKKSLVLERGRKTETMNDGTLVKTNILVHSASSVVPDTVTTSDRASSSNNGAWSSNDGAPFGGNKKKRAKARNWTEQVRLSCTE
jgi:hypothetical protein